MRLSALRFHRDLGRSRAVGLALLLTVSLLGCAGGAPPGDGSSTNNGDSTEPCQDLDGDGFDGRNAECPDGADCNDRVASTHPDAEEVCNDGVDNNCDGDVDENCRDSAAANCTDEDGDRYGEGAGCFGPDCNDNDAKINPSAIEVCGNAIDEDCKDGDLECPTNCVDADGDGYGAAGSTDCTGSDGSVQTEIDCDDGSAAVNPAAVEICNMIDDDCDGEIDECAGAGQACAGDRCMGGAGAECENHDQCAGSLRCDSSQSPRVCRQPEGGECSDTAECLNGLACDQGQCSGDFCAVNSCEDPAYAHCDEDAGACVQCPYWEPDFEVQDAACPENTLCTPGGWCAEPWNLQSAAPRENTTTTEDLFWTSIALALCWNETRPAGEKAVCFSFWLSDEITRPITEALLEDAYVGGHMDNELYPEENDALHDIWGEGVFNRKEIDWKVDLAPGTSYEICLWYQPGSGIVSGETLVVDNCANFAP